MKRLLQTDWTEILYLLLNFRTMEHEHFFVCFCLPAMCHVVAYGEMFAVTNTGVTANGTARDRKKWKTTANICVNRHDYVCIHLSGTKLYILEGHRKNAACKTINSVHQLRVYSYPYIFSTRCIIAQTLLYRSNFTVKLHSRV
jgi:hypothetical protein